MTGFDDAVGARGRPPYRWLGLALLVSLFAVTALVYGQFRGALQSWTNLTLHADRAGLVMEPGAKVTFNGVEIGRVSNVAPLNQDDTTIAELTLQVQPRYVQVLPADVVADVTATTVFGNKYVSFLSPDNPSAQRVSPAVPIQVHSVSTEFNTLFETITAISEQVDPVKLNSTLSATAEALTGLGEQFGTSLVNGDQILDQINPRLPQLQHSVRGLADLADIYAAASPDLWQALDGVATTAATLNARNAELDAALLAAAGFGSTATDVFERSGPYLVRGAADMVPTSRTLNYHSPSLLCTIRNYNRVSKEVMEALGSNGYSLTSASGGGMSGGKGPYHYPENLPRINAHGGPGGKPGCWKEITRDLWPAPFLVMDTGASVAPYNHVEVGQPMLVDYVWGRQIGEYTINP